FLDGTVYDGEWADGVFSGEGTLTWANRCSYKGSFVKGKRSGYGQCTFPGGETYKGDWLDDEMHGKVESCSTNPSTLTVNGRELAGTWTRGKPDFAPPLNGYGAFIFPD
ncbi:unnamed protein product, partial [Chrysoparadoxa australica]